MPKKLLSIIVPIYNEAKIIKDSLPPVFNLKINKEIIIIDDGSSDETNTILKTLQNNYKFKLIEKNRNQGKGQAIKTALQYIAGDYFIVYDADQEYKAQDIVYLLEEIKKEKKEKTVIYGSRFLTTYPHNFHYLINKFLTSITNILFGSQLTDMETCLKIIPRSALDEIKLEGGRFEIEPEITAQLLKNSYTIRERAITYTHRSYQEGKKIKARDGLLAIKTLISERLKR